MCLIYTILSLRSWAAWAVFGDALNTSPSHNYENCACWNFKEEESVFRVVARAREPWKPTRVGVSELEERPLGSVTRTSTLGLARLAPGVRACACRSQACRAEQGRRREKQARLCRGTELTHYREEGQSSVPANCHPENIYPVFPDLSSFRRNQKSGFLCEIFKIGPNISNNILAKLNMSLAPRIPVFAFICVFLSSPFSTLKASEGRAQELLTNSMTWQDWAAPFFDTHPAFTPLHLHFCCVFVKVLFFLSSGSNSFNFQGQAGCLSPMMPSQTDTIAPSLALPEQSTVSIHI